jgi:hypothetical protein
MADSARAGSRDVLKPFRIRCAAGLVAAAILISVPLSIQSQSAHKQKSSLFQTSDRCFACHNGLATSSGEDISIGFDWRPSMMANSARDPYWQASVRRETVDHPESRAAIEDECSICHMPMARFESKVSGHAGEVFSHLGFDAGKAGDRLAEDGVSCSLCHQIDAEKLGTRESFVGGFVIDTTKPKGERPEYGQFKIENGENRIMRSSSGGFRPTEAKHIQQSELCATCHTLYTKAIGPNGQINGELPEQMPYLEWLESDYKEKQSCQSCHMPVIKEEVRIANVLGKFREGFSRHVFVGGNFFMQRLLNRYRNDLSTDALPQELEAAAARTVEHLKSSTARIAIERADASAVRLEADVLVQNLSGHKFPTAYPSRRAWLHVVVRDRDGRVVFESGALDPNGLIRGNDNDADPTRYEPHYTQITSPDQVQIYEAIMVDQNGQPTTGLLSAVRYEKDNRLLPTGFNKQAAAKDIAVRGGAVEDRDFTAGEDRIRYSIALGDALGPFKIDVELWFQPISYRWASNLRPYNAEEPRRFTGYYDSMASSSAVMLAHVEIRRP